MNQVLGFGLAAGEGVRLRPLTLKAGGYIRSKAAVKFLGERIIVWMLKALQAQGMDRAVIITRGRENHAQVKSAVGYGENLGMALRYSPIELDGPDVGSAGAVLNNVACFHPNTDALFVFPTDSLLEFDLAEMVTSHRRSGAAVTIAVTEQPATTIANQYGMINVDDERRVRGFLEKPSLDDICALHGVSRSDAVGLPPLHTNAGFYVMDPDMLHSIRGSLRSHYGKRPIDIGGDLLPWLVAHGYPVYCHPVHRMGDLGNIPAYLETMGDALAGHFPTSAPLPEAQTVAGPGLYVDPTSWAMGDPVSGLTLQEKVARGLVALHTPVRIGRYVRIGVGAILKECNIDDECFIGERVTIARSSIGESSVLGPNCRVSDAVLGTMVRVLSTREHPVTISGSAALGDEAIIGPGATITGRVGINPRESVPAGIVYTSPSEVTSLGVQSGARDGEARPGVDMFPTVRVA